MHTDLHNFAIRLLRELIRIPSYSKEEDNTAVHLQQRIEQQGIEIERIANNIVARTPKRAGAPVVLLNSHHDTVRPSQGWNSNPYEDYMPDVQTIVGLGSNDAGASVVSLLATFLYFYKHPHPIFDFVFLASAEEEISGTQGAELALTALEPIAFGIVGEPTSMRMAVAEKGLIVLDCIATGKAGHAAHNTGENAIYKALHDIEWLKTYTFPRISPRLGPVKMTVTGIEAGTQHNVVPDLCKFMVDVRTNELYSNKEVYEIIAQHVQAEVKARSFRLNSSYISPNHAIVTAATRVGIEQFGSPTMSDQVFMHNFPTVKIGPGDTTRSHTANEYIKTYEIEQAIDLYIQLLLSITDYE